MNPLLAAARRETPLQLMRKKRFWANMTLGFVLVMLGLVMGVCSSCQSVPEGPYIPTGPLNEDNRQNFEKLVNDANALYAVQPRNEERMRECAAKFDAALKLSNQEYAMLWQGARAFAWLAGFSARSEYRKECSLRGIEYARTALKVKPEATEGLFYLAVLSGYLAREDESYGLDAVKLIEDCCKKIIESGVDIEHGGAHRVYGALLSNPRLPGPPTSIGSLRNGKKQVELAVEKAPNWPENHLYMADCEFQWAKDRKKPDFARQARERLEQWLLRSGARAPEGYEFEFRDWQQKARALLAQYP